MKKFIIIIVLSLLAISSKAHAQEYGTCCYSQYYNPYQLQPIQPMPQTIIVQPVGFRGF